MKMYYVLRRREEQRDWTERKREKIDYSLFQSIVHCSFTVVMFIIQSFSLIHENYFPRFCIVTRTLNQKIIPSTFNIYKWRRSISRAIKPSGSFEFWIKFMIHTMHMAFHLFHNITLTGVQCLWFSFSIFFRSYCAMAMVSLHTHTNTNQPCGIWNRIEPSTISISTMCVWMCDAFGHIIIRAMNLISIEILILDFRICPIQSDKAFFANRENRTEDIAW